MVYNTEVGIDFGDVTGWLISSYQITSDVVGWEDYSKIMPRSSKGSPVKEVLEAVENVVGV